MNNISLTASIILCTFNGKKKINACLDSLVNQNYPKEKYEVIVVDDGSTEDLFSVIKQYKVVYLKHNVKRGLGTARNTGLKTAKGDIIICFDDDCIADHNWLSSLLKAYDDQNVIGAGGMLFLPSHATLTDEYCFQLGYGAPIPKTFGRSKSMFIRFIDYLRTYFSNPQAKFKDMTEVFELPGVASSFRKNDLLSVGGWNESLVGIAEDTELCDRLRITFPDKRFVVMSSAKLYHAQKLIFLQFLQKEFKRGVMRKQYYKMKEQVPPYFPFPVLFTFLSLILVYYKFYILIPFIPLVLYPWWLIRLVNEKNIRMILFPYMQLLHEGATITGMLFF